MKTRINRQEKGVALLFALGLLALMLTVGMAFVANSVIARKVAANNSARTQARLFAFSAINRAAAAIMLYQQQIWSSADQEFPDNFSAVYSYSTPKETDQLLGKSYSEPLPKLPSDDSVVAKMLAEKFNGPFVNGTWPGSWVYFYDSHSHDRIVGRAAWQTLSTSPSILAPVFFRGHLEADTMTPEWRPSNHRWGRGIDEVVLSNTTNLQNASTYAGGTIKDFSTLFGQLGCSSDNAKKRWIERWLVPDPNGEGAFPMSPNGPPSLTVPEVYYAKENNKSYALMRFNISEFTQDTDSSWHTRYGVNNLADPWYARFGIDSTVAESNQCNTAAVLDKLTADSLLYQQGDEYDYDIAAADRSGLPFLRRIGNSTELGTFADVTTLRKQIAANFNDYCDADGVPTSDVKATLWGGDLNTTGYTEPAFTGNEKTPYLYELGFQIGFHRSNSDLDKTGFTTSATVSGDVVTLSVSDPCLRVGPMVKLANIYPFNPEDTPKHGNIGAKVDPGLVTLIYKLNQLSLKCTVNYTVNDVSGSKSVELSLSDLKEKNNDELTAESKKLRDTEFSFTATTDTADTINPHFSGGEKLLFPNSEVNNSSGAKPYPFKHTSADAADNAVWLTATAKSAGSVIFRLDAATINKHGGGLPSGATVTGISNLEVAVTGISVVKLTIQPRRAVLLATGQLPGTAADTEFGIDYVKKFDAPLVWQNDAGENLVVNTNNKTQGILAGGLCNYDPRQNLNNGDWNTNVKVSAAIAEINGAKGYTNPSEAEIDAVMYRSTFNNIQDGVETDIRFSAKGAKADSETGKDAEDVTGPGWTGTTAEAADASHLSTAFIRNAPMMSPWEIGFIHRGIRWQTLNLKSAGDPDADDMIKPTSYTPNDGSWTRSGTTYATGDGAILDQIKMTEQCLTYGKINVNLLRSNHADFPTMGTLDKDMFIALFDQLRYGQPPQNLFTVSTRNAETKEFPTTADAGSALTASDSGYAAFTASRPALQGRAQFLDWSSQQANGLTNAFGLISSDNLLTDARQEEIIGKTINLLTADTPTPTQIQMVVVAQSIRDVGGEQFRPAADAANLSGSPTAEDGMVSKSCSLGQFDAYIHSTDDGKNVYFDEITGEVKAFVTLGRDAVSGRLRVQRIDYIE